MLERLPSKWRSAIVLGLPAILGLALFCDSARAQGVTLANSHWGAGGAGTDLQGRIYRPVMLDTYLPLDTSGWTPVDVSCSWSALESAIGAITSSSDPTVIYVDATNCTMTVTGTSTIDTISNSIDKLVVRGNADGLTRILVDPAGLPADVEGFPNILWQVGSTSPTTIDSWVWSHGFAKGDTIVGTDGSTGNQITEVYVGDLIEQEVNQWNDGSANWRRFVEVECARWHDGTLQGPTACTDLLTVNNRIKVDRENPFQMEGTGLELVSSPITGHTLRHVERIGGGTIDDDNVPMHIGWENLTIEHAEPYMVKKSFSAWEVYGCHECWLEDVKILAWGNTAVEDNSSQNSATSRFLMKNVDIEGPFFAARCVITVNSITEDTTPLQINVDGADCAPYVLCGGLEPLVYFPPDFDEPILRDTVFDCDSADGTPDSSVDMTLRYHSDGSDLNGDPVTVTSPSTNNVGTLLKNYDIAAVKFAGQSSESQWINGSCIDCRVSFITQHGGYESAVYGLYEHYTGSGVSVSRGLFTHGGPNAGGLYERNHLEAGIVPMEGAIQGRGSGPYITYAFNRGVPPPAQTTTISTQCDSGGICVGGTDLQGHANQFRNWIGNFFSSIRNDGNGLDWCDNDDDQSRDCSNPGSEVPFNGWEDHWERNIVYGETLLDDFETTGGGNPTSTLTDYLEGDQVDSGADAGWSTAWPTSIGYDRQVELDAAFSPSWWCQESGPFHAGMGAPADDYNGGSPSYSKLPAQIRYEGGPCTPVAATSATFKILGGAVLGGGSSIN